MEIRQIFPAWRMILEGRRPFLAVELTRHCPLRCPGCYASSPGHEGAPEAKNGTELHGAGLVEGVFDLTRKLRPLHLSLVGGEPLLRRRELDLLLPRLAPLETQIVTSAVRPVPPDWAAYPHVRITVSVDGLAPEHNRRRAPATYERILANIGGHRVIVHCTVTRQMMERRGYLEEFAAFWSARDEVRKIWFSLFTPQTGDLREERLGNPERERAIADMGDLAARFPKVHMPRLVLKGYSRPPGGPEECIFAQVTTCLAPDLKTRIAPCEIGGTPECRECGCLASAALAAIGRYRLAGALRVGDIFRLSSRIGTARVRRRTDNPERP